MASKAMQWAATIALGLTLMGSAKGVDDSQTINITRDNKTPEAVEGKMGSADNPISRELKINTEGVIDKVPVITTDRGASWIITDGGKGHPNVTVGNTPKEKDPRLYIVDVDGVSRLTGGKGTGDPTYEWTALENYRMVKAAIFKVPTYLYANATYYVPVTVAFAGLPTLQTEEIIDNGQTRRQLYFKDEQNGKKYILTLQWVTALCRNTSHLSWDENGCGDIEIELGSSQRVTFWMLPPSDSMVQSHYDCIANDDAQWTIKFEISDADAKTPFRFAFEGDGHDNKVKTEYLISPEIAIIEMGEIGIKGGGKIFSYDPGSQNFIYLKSHNNQYNSLARDVDFKELSLNTPYDWDSKIEHLLEKAKVLGECATNSESKQLMSHALLSSSRFGTNPETFELTCVKPTISMMFNISYRRTTTPLGLDGMDLVNTGGSLRYIGAEIPVVRRQEAKTTDFLSSEVVSHSVVVGSVIGGVAFEKIASSLLKKLSSWKVLTMKKGLQKLITDTSSAITSAYINKAFEQDLAQGGEFEKAYSDITAEVIVQQIEPSVNDNSTLLRAAYNPFDSQNSIPISLSGSVSVGEKLWIEAHTSSTVYITTQFWERSGAKATFSLPEPEKHLRAFKID